MDTDAVTADAQPPRTLRGRAGLVGPGLVAAATGVGAGDIVSSLAAGARLGMALLWAIVLGAVLKYALAEGVGRWHLTSGSTILHGWRSLGRWTMWYFGVYIIIWGFSFGAAAMSATALPLNALFPALSIQAWGIICGVVGFVLVALGRYELFERVMTVLVGVMFVTVVGCAVAVLSDVESFTAGLRPQLPPDSIVYVLGLLGGVGGSITLAAYGYWIREKGWRRPAWMGVMRLDNGVAYLITGIFVVAMMVVGTALLFETGQEIAGEEGLVDFSAMLAQRLGRGVRLLFLLSCLLPVPPFVIYLILWLTKPERPCSVPLGARGLPVRDEPLTRTRWSVRFPPCQGRDRRRRRSCGSAVRPTARGSPGRGTGPGRRW